MAAEAAERQQQEKEKVMKITIPVPPGAPPGTVLLVPVKGGTQKVKVKVPQGLGEGSTLILKQAEGSDEWAIEPGKVVPPPAGATSSQASPGAPAPAPAPSEPSSATDAAAKPQMPKEPAAAQQPSQDQRQQLPREEAVTPPKPKEPVSWEEQQRLLALKFEEQERRRQAGLEPELDEDEAQMQRQRHAQLLKLQEEDREFDRKQEELARMYAEQQKEHTEPKESSSKPQTPERAKSPEPAKATPSPPRAAAPLQWQQPEEQLQRESRHREELQNIQQPQIAEPFDSPVAYTVRLDTTVGPIDIIVRPDWAPHGARRFLDLATAGDLDDLAFYRAIKGCIAQFGLPAKRRWDPIPDDPPIGVPFLLGAVSFAAAGAGSRRSALFICTGDMSHCLGQDPWETPIGAVAEQSLDVLERINTTYGDIAEFNGHGPDTGRINQEGNKYLRTHFPLLTYIRSTWPLDWPEHGNPQDISGADAAGGEPTPQDLEEQARIAAEAAKRAQMKAWEATEAARLARQAASSDHVEQAMQAAQTADTAARAAAQAANAAKAAAAVVRRQQRGTSAQRGASLPGHQPTSPFRGNRGNVGQATPGRPSFIPPVTQNSPSTSQAFQASRPSYIPTPVQQSSPSFVPTPSHAPPPFTGQVITVQSPPSRAAVADQLAGSLSRTTQLHTQGAGHIFGSLSPQPPPPFISQRTSSIPASSPTPTIPQPLGSTTAVQVVPPMVGQRPALTQQVVQQIPSYPMPSARTATPIPAAQPTIDVGSQRQSVRPIAWDAGRATARRGPQTAGMPWRP